MLLTSFLHAVLESNAKGVLELINSKLCSYANIGIVIKDIVALSRQFEGSNDLHQNGSYQGVGLRQEVGIVGDENSWCKTEILSD